ncbi:Peroxiredoxin [Oceanobacillus limi]|uniref:Peroxiredoxin n=1 Tax=Oceanobacillus limi TaxID=930131 RepID=A0A1H9Z8M7_9BACI|nr:TlpA disulfide reductase family protein [Oceanobacillus limi]SES77948.1 Peroxiredoxin [Oceanobacillus limi]
MVKQIFGTLLIACLGIILVYNLFQSSTKTTEEENFSADATIDGGVISSPGASGLEVGQTAPDFELRTMDGEIVKLSDYLGKKVILNFWASWCGPCKKEMPEMQTYYNEHKDEVEILAVNVTDSETNEKKVEDFIQKHNYSYPILMDRSNHVTEEYVAITIPTTYFIDTEGIIHHPRKVGPMTYEFIEEMVSKMN